MACPAGYGSRQVQKTNPAAPACPDPPKLVRKRTHARHVIGLLNQQTTVGKDRFAYSRYIPRFLKEHGGEWPPRPKFTGWPSSWVQLARLADEMPSRLATSSSVKEFRSWMCAQCMERVQGEVVLSSIEDLIQGLEAQNDEDPDSWAAGLDRLFGLLGCTTYLVQNLSA